MGEDKAPTKDDYMRKRTEQTKMQATINFIYNSEHGTFLGRTGKSWLKIAVFYVIFYFFLLLFWYLMFLIFSQTLDQVKPTYYGEDGIIGTNPGMGYRPRPPEKFVDSTLINFRNGNQNSFKHWVKALNEFFDEYENKDSDNQNVQQGEHIQNCDFEKYKRGDSGTTENKVCFFDLKKLSAPCVREDNFGFSQANPCIFVKLNRIFGWKPQPYTNVSALPNEMPKQLKDVIKKNADKNGGTPDPMVWVSCEGENAADKEFIGVVNYQPMQGFPAYYFPFVGTAGYLSPFVAIHFQQPESGVLINIECKAWAQNIKHTRADRLGSVHFELLVD